MELLPELSRIVGADRVSASPADRLALARDCWQRDLLELREGRTPPGPELVVWPESVAEVSSILALAAKRKIHVVPFGGGSGVCGSARASSKPAGLFPAPERGTIALDMKRMRAIRSLDERSGTAEVETGIVGEILERELNARGWTLGHFPSSIYCSTLGGFVAARSAGQLSTRYGKIEDMVRGLELVLPDGTIARLHSRAAAPDLSQIFIGAEGTLGICTAATLALERAPEEQVLRAWSFRGVAPGMDAIRALLQSGLTPAVVRLYDEFDTLMALSGSRAKKKKHFEDLLDSGSGVSDLFGLFPALRARGIGLLLGNAAYVNRFADGLGRKALLITMFEGPKGGTALDAEEGARILAAAGGTDLGEAPAAKWKAKRYAVSYNQSKVFAAGAFNDTAEVAATWDKLPELYERVKHAIGKHAFVMAHFSHAYPEGCSIYFTFVGHGADAASSRTLYDRIWSDLLAATVEAGGTISHHHGVGLSKARFLPDELGAGGTRALRAIHSGFDPGRRFNTGKLLGPAGENETVKSPAIARRKASLETRLEEITGADGILAGRDAESFLGVELGKKKPRVVAASNSAEIEAVLAAAAESGSPVFIAGTSSRGIDWSELPAGESLVLDMRRFDALLRVDETSLTVTTQSGLACAALERALEKKGLTVGFALTGFAERVSIGGLLATGLPPLASPRSGTILDHVVNVGFALADGTRVRTRIAPRAATGPDLDALVIGARGALGVITEATIRVAKIPDARKLLGFGFRSVEDALHSMAELVASGLAPSAAGIWPAAPGKRGARLAVELAGSSEEVRASASAVKRRLKELGARLDPRPDTSWFAHADAAAAALNGQHEPIWVRGDFAALARAAGSTALSQHEALFGIPCFDRRGGYAVAAAGGGSAKRLLAFREAGCDILSEGGARPVPFSATDRAMLAQLKSALDPGGRLNPGTLDG